MIEHNGNHATLFFTSTMTNGTINVTFVNRVEVFRFFQLNSTTYMTNTTINNFRDRSNDLVDHGKLSLSVYNTTMMITESKSNFVR